MNTQIVFLPTISTTAIFVIMGSEDQLTMDLSRVFVCFLIITITIDCYLHSSFFPEAVRCSTVVDVSGSFYYDTGTSGCRDGYVDPITGQCTSSCGTGNYGVTVYSNRGLVETS